MMLWVRNAFEYLEQNMKHSFMLSHLQDLSYQTTRRYTIAHKQEFIKTTGSNNTKIKY